MMHWIPLDAWVVGTAVPISLIIFAAALWRKWRLLNACTGACDPVADYPERARELLTVFAGQKKLFQDFVPGVMHALIFWGFCALLLRAMTLFGMALSGFEFHLPLLGPGTWMGKAYGVLKDAANYAVTLMVLLALWRRYVERVPRLKNTGEALFVLLMILGLMLSDMLFEAAHTGALAFAGFSFATAAALGHGALLYHCVAILVFLAYLPAGKHMHIITSVFNVGLRPLRRGGRLSKLDLADESVETFGTPHIEHLGWKDALDLYTCTECGRCNDSCPAQGTGKKLAPREVVSQQKACLYREADRLLAKKNGKEPEELVPGVVTPEELWACTTCQSCEQACPVSISHVQRINSMRRSEVLMQGRFPHELKRVFKGLETNSNPWGMGAAGRLEWAKGLELPLWRKTPGAEYLLYLGCASSFDDRGRKVSRSLFSLLKRSGVSFAVLGEEELCCGETARRLGEEALGQTLIEANVRLLGELGVKKILTPCPHCFNVIKNEYPDFGGRFETVHHTQLLLELLHQGRLKSASGLKARVAVHDSCYLGRVNGVYQPARELLAAAGAQAVEPERSRESGFCCGAGGGMFWLEEKGPRVNYERVRQLSKTRSALVATSCPYCLTMIENGVKDLGEKDLGVKDLAEILEAAG
ncbi:MAG: (Fe-S)-binding protein [Elusimicrobia bacterium]|nr:(Fe-S)-binding protein [Elusimicrobiota bacterium]